MSEVCFASLYVPPVVNIHHWSMLSSDSIIRMYDTSRRDIFDAIIALKIKPEFRRIKMDDEFVYRNYFHREQVRDLIRWINEKRTSR